MEPSGTDGRRLDGRLALVIGAGSGIGRATALRLAREGAAVIVADVELDAARATAEDLPGDGHRAVFIDVLDRVAVEHAVEEAAPTAALDVLVHVAGGDTPHGPFEETDDEVWQDMLELNLLGPVRAVRAALPMLRRSTGSASVVLVGSVNGSLALGSEPYSAAKAGLVSLVTNLAGSLGPEGVRVNAVAPGTIRTRVWDDQDGPDRLAPLYPLRRIGEPEDVAAAIAFLCSSDAAWITGHVLPVDGGLHSRDPLAGR